MNHARSFSWRWLGFALLALCFTLVWLARPHVSKAQEGTIPNPMLSKSDGNVTLAPGASVVYHLTYTNPGPTPMTGVILTETVPANTTFLPANNPGWSCNGTICTYAVGALNQGG